MAVPTVLVSSAIGTLLLSDNRGLRGPSDAQHAVSTEFGVERGGCVELKVGNFRWTLLLRFSKFHPSSF